MDNGVVNCAQSSTWSSLSDVVRQVGALNAAAMARARARQAQLTKPPGSLGRLERLSVQLAGIAGTEQPRLTERTVVIMAADHGVAAEGVSAYPSAVTAQMLLNFASGGAAINVLAQQVGARVLVVDVGVAADLPLDLPVLHRKVAYGSGNLARESALTVEQVERAIGVGLDVAADLGREGNQVVCLGEMGIGNTTAASAVLAGLTGLPAEGLTGRGTGVDDAVWRRKVALVDAAVAARLVTGSGPLDVLREVGGLEIAALVGLSIGAAAARMVVVLDGFIATVAALLAAEVCPSARGFMVAAHRSVEPGHVVALQRLELEPLLALDLRLGEGTGATLALPLLDAAAAVLDRMATFGEAGVSGPADAVAVG